MSNLTTSDSGCPVPFLSDAAFNSSTGLLAGRFCAPVGLETCCLPCPKTDYLYPDNFKAITNAASWLDVVGTACTVFLLVSWAVLPRERTHRHYLSICLAIGVTMLQLGFIIPLAARPDQCADAITPNDMYSNRTCAVSGSFLLAGGWCGVMWVFMRALYLHLQICWQRTLGNGFMYASLAAGWGIPAALLAVALALSGVSFRFGETCHINHKNSLADFWIPLLVFAGSTVIIQCATFTYCIKVYLASLRDQSNTTTEASGSGLPSYNGTIRSVSPRQAYRRVRRVIELQWRGIAIVLVIVADVVFFAVVFVVLDNQEESVIANPAKASHWTLCLIQAAGDKNQCLSLANRLIVSEATVMAVLVLLSLNGIWLFLLMFRFTILDGWMELFRRQLKPSSKDFVSVDAKLNFAKDARSYEMLSKEAGKNPEPIITSTSPPPAIDFEPQVMRSGRSTPDYFGREATYHHPSSSFSSPRPPTNTLFAGSSPLQPHPYRPQSVYSPP